MEVFPKSTHEKERLRRNGERKREKLTRKMGSLWDAHIHNALSCASFPGRHRVRK
jgi:hypothetical protein